MQMIPGHNDAILVGSSPVKVSNIVFKAIRQVKATYPLFTF
jgi:hypothetical protein